MIITAKAIFSVTVEKSICSLFTPNWFCFALFDVYKITHGSQYRVWGLEIYMGIKKKYRIICKYLFENGGG